MELTVEWAVAKVAQRVLCRRVATALDSGWLDWGDYPDIGEDDWTRVEAAVEASCPDVADDEYGDAYAFLADRAKDEEA